ncbi:MAG: aminodeoxychorismate lyase [Stenotrophobium sp.]
MNALFNGEAAGDWAQSRGLHYGDGVFRTVLIWNGEPLDWNLHLAKLGGDCYALGLDMPPGALLLADARKLAGGQQRAVLKLMVIRKSDGRGYRASGTASDRLCLLFPAPCYPASHWEHGIAAFRCELRLAAQPALAGIKHLNRLEQVLATRSWPSGIDEGILCDRDGHPICGTRSNLCWVQDGVVGTPVLDECGVSGIMLNKIKQMSEQIKVNFVTRKISWDALLSSSEVFVCNSLIGIWPLSRLDQRTWPCPGPITMALQQAFAHPRLS